MVINSIHKFVFIHIPKTAGTSISNGLAGLDGNNARWVAKTKHETFAMFEKNIGGRLSFFDRFKGDSPLSYFKFCFVRNPWDRMSSFYRYLQEARPRKEIDTVTSFKDFLLQAEAGEPWIQTLHSMKPQADYLCALDGTINIDFLGHFEFLKEDLESISNLIDVTIPLAHQNKSSNAVADYRTDYDDEMIDLVARRYSKDIDLFGYSFDKKNPARRISQAFELAG